MTTEKKIRRRRPSTFPAVLSITLVLFLFGLLGLVLFNAKKITDYLKENFEIQVLYKDSITEDVALKHCMDLKNNVGIKSVQFIDKSAAAEKMKAELGQDFIEALGSNPLPHGSLIYLKSKYASDTFVRKFAAELMLNPMVSDVEYPVNLLKEMNRNISVIGTVLLALSFVFLFVAIGLINSTIRLTMFAKRFTIKSMLLVGATEWFIIKPFLGKFFMVGLISALIAGMLLSGVLTLLVYWYPWLIELFDAKLYIFIFGILILTGILIVELSTWFSTRKYLRIKLDLLY